MTASKPAPPKPAGPGPKPSGPTHPGMPTPGGPRIGDTDLLGVIDAQLVALIAIAYFGPPGSAAAAATAACESTGAGNSGAGASSGRGGKGAVERAPRPVMPDTRVPLTFAEGRDRLVGRIAIGTGPVYDALPRWSR